MSFLERGRKAADPTAEKEDHLLARSTPAWSHFGGVEIIEDGAILRWDTEYGNVGMVYRVPFDHHSVRQFANKLGWKYRRDLPSAYASLVSVEHTMGWYGPDLEAVDISRRGNVSDRYQPICEEVAPSPVAPGLTGLDISCRSNAQCLEGQPGFPTPIRRCGQ